MGLPALVLAAVFGVDLVQQAARGAYTKSFFRLLVGASHALAALYFLSFGVRLLAKMLA